MWKVDFNGSYFWIIIIQEFRVLIIFDLWLRSDWILYYNIDLQMYVSTFLKHTQFQNFNKTTITYNLNFACYISQSILQFILFCQIFYYYIKWYPITNIYFYSFPITERRITMMKILFSKILHDSDLKSLKHQPRKHIMN